MSRTFYMNFKNKNGEGGGWSDDSGNEFSLLQNGDITIKVGKGNIDSNDRAELYLTSHGDTVDNRESTNRNTNGSSVTKLDIEDAAKEAKAFITDFRGTQPTTFSQFSYMQKQRIEAFEHNLDAIISSSPTPSPPPAPPPTPTQGATPTPAASPIIDKPTAEATPPVEAAPVAGVRPDASKPAAAVRRSFNSKSLKCPDHYTHAEIHVLEEAKLHPNDRREIERAQRILEHHGFKHLGGHINPNIDGIAGHKTAHALKEALEHGKNGKACKIEHHKKKMRGHQIEP